MSFSNFSKSNFTCFSCLGNRVPFRCTRRKTFSVDGKLRPRPCSALSSFASSRPPPSSRPKPSVRRSMLGVWKSKGFCSSGSTGWGGGWRARRGSPPLNRYSNRPSCGRTDWTPRNSSKNNCSSGGFSHSDPAVFLPRPAKN